MGFIVGISAVMFLREINSIVGSTIGNTFHNNTESEGYKVSENIGTGINSIPGENSFVGLV